MHNAAMEDEIYADIVKAARTGATRSRIKACIPLASNQVNKHLDDIRRQDLIAYDPKTDTFIATRKGMNFLEAYEDASDVMRPLKDLA